MGIETSNSWWRGRRVLITGCAGFLGSWLARCVCERGAHLVGLDPVAISDSSPLRRFGFDTTLTLISGQLEDYPLIERLLGEHQAEVVFHLAAQSQVGAAKKFPQQTFEANIRGTWNLLEAIRVAGRPIRVIIASSDAVYGNSQQLPYAEETPLLGLLPYDVSKRCTELIAQSYHSTYGMPVCITRCTNVYGGGDLNFQRIIPGTIRAVMRSEAPEIRSNGLVARDYLYVEDAVEAYMSLAQSMDRPEAIGEIFNFCSEAPVTVLGVVRTILRLMNRADLAPLILNQTTDELPVKYSSARKAKERLKWSARVPLEDGLRRTIDCYLAMPDLAASLIGSGRA